MQIPNSRRRLDLFSSAHGGENLAFHESIIIRFRSQRSRLKIKPFCPFKGHHNLTLTARVVKFIKRD